MLDNTLKDGKGITLVFDLFGDGDSSNLTAVIDPTSITPPALDGGDGIDTTTLSNETYRTKQARSLIEVTDGSMTVAYDPAIWETNGAGFDISDVLNHNGKFTITFPNDDTVDFYGYIKSFTPSELVEGEMPTAEIAIVVTNYQDADHPEVGPVWTTG